MGIHCNALDFFFCYFDGVGLHDAEARKSGVFVLFYLITVRLGGFGRFFGRYNRTSIELVASDSAWFVYFSSSVFIDWI
jgi:hypothetical protein